MMRRFAIAAGLFVLALAANAQERGARKTDQELIQGTWWIVGLENGGKQQSDKGFKGNSMTFSKARLGNTLTLVERGHKEVEFAYTLDPAKSPKEINLAIKGNKALGIYKLEGDDLTICVGLTGTRPSDFATRGGGDSETFTLKRNRWERHAEAGVFAIDFPGRPVESKRAAEDPDDKRTIRTLSVRSEMDRLTYSVTIVPLSSTPRDATLSLDLAQKELLAGFDSDANPRVEAETRLLNLPPGVSAARELTISVRLPQSRDRGAARVRLYVVGERVFALGVSGSDDVMRSPSANRFWGSFRSPADKRKEFPGKQR
jgi:uncharacterized protein (TIGR03067 family)